MVRIIKERLEQIQVDFSASSCEGVTGESHFYGGNDGNYLHGESPPNHAAGEGLRTLPPAVSYGEWDGGLTRRDRAWSSVSSTASSSMRAAFDEDLVRGWQPVDEAVQRRARPAWKCKYCQGVGWAEEEPCDGCGRYLPENVYMGSFSRQLIPTREGDWICVCCGNTNWEWRTQCNRCHTCRDGTPLVEVEGIVKHRLKKRLSTHPAGVFKDNDWVCVSCGNINWDWRVKCHQCGCGKPTVAVGSSSSC